MTKQTIITLSKEDVKALNKVSVILANISDNALWHVNELDDLASRSNADKEIRGAVIRYEY